jgi:hypothetical protein
MIRFNPSNSSNRIGGGGSFGERRITEDSTWGGGRKLPARLASARAGQDDCGNGSERVIQACVRDGGIQR